MSWAARRRFAILLIIGAVAVAFLAILSISVFYKAPTCTDSRQNQNETGVDCGGPCAYLCTAEEYPPTVLFTKALSNGAGRTDVIAMVENKNADAAAKHVPYEIALYGVEQVLIQKVSGTLDLPPNTTIPVYVPGIALGKQAVTQAFLTIDTSALLWYSLTSSTDERVMPRVSNTTQTGTIGAPRIDALLTNTNATPLTNVQVIVLVRDEQGNVLAASSTVVPSIPAQGKTTATFTWNSAFPNIPASIEVVPIIPLP